MDIVKLQARVREGAGKSYTRKARAQGWVPAIYYGHDQEPKKIEVAYRDFATLARKKQLTHLIDLGLAGEDSIAVVREVQRHVLKDTLFYHVDFMHVAMNEKVVVEVPLELTGIAFGVKNDNGVLGHPIKVVKVECLPRDIPEKVSIDVSELKIGDSIHVKDVSFPNFTIKDSPDEVLAVVTHGTREAASEAKPEEPAAS